MTDETFPRNHTCEQAIEHNFNEREQLCKDKTTSVALEADGSTLVSLLAHIYIPFWLSTWTSGPIGTLVFLILVALGPILSGLAFRSYHCRIHFTLSIGVNKNIRNICFTPACRIFVSAVPFKTACAAGPTPQPLLPLPRITAMIIRNNCLSYLKQIHAKSTSTWSRLPDSAKLFRPYLRTLQSCKRTLRARRPEKEAHAKVCV